MRTSALLSLLMCTVSIGLFSDTALAQWQQSAGPAALNMQ